MSTAFSGGGYRVFDGLGNTAEAFDFRAIGPDLVTPVYQQWNIGLQLGLGHDMAWEVRYKGSVSGFLQRGVGSERPRDASARKAPDHTSVPCWRRDRERRRPERPQPGDGPARCRLRL
jgi:hypothetical protein